MDWEGLVEISRYYGSDPEYLLAGGGNTSCKDDRYLYVKASGFVLAGIGIDGFVRLDRKALDRIWEKEYPANTDLREQQALQDLMNARAAGETRRPSVESLLHAALPQAYVVHTHPALVNGLTCGNDGERTALSLFGSRCMWIPSLNPGYTLACKIKKNLDAHIKAHDRLPEIIFLANHGMFIGAADTAGIKALHLQVREILRQRVIRDPDFSETGYDRACVDKFCRHITAYPAFRNTQVVFRTNKEVGAVTADASAFVQVHSAFTPDHIVYAGPENLFCERPEALYTQLDDYRRRNGLDPRIIALKQTGAFALGASPDSARTAMLLFLDSVKVAVYAASFGGYRFMDKEQIDFIKHWEVEKFRAKMILEQ